MKNVLLLFVLVIVGLPACTATPIEQRWADELAALEMGMDREAFEAALPSAYLRGKQDGTTVYALRDRQYDFGQDSFINQDLHFYFEDGQLSQWGRPGDWRADVTADVRMEE